MKYLKGKVKVLIMALTFMVSIASNSLVYSQTIKVTDKFGNELRAKSDPLTNSIKKIYQVKAPISRYGTSFDQITKSNVEQLGRSIIKDYENILDISSDDLEAIKTRYRKSKWYLNFKQLYKEIPVYGSYLRYSIKENGMVGTLTANIHPDIKVNVDPTISIDAAVVTAMKAFELDGTDSLVVREKPSLIVYPKIEKESVSYYLAYKIDLLSKTPSQNLLHFVDAHSGILIDIINGRVDTDYSNDGTISVKYYTENPTDTPPTTYATPSGINVKIYVAGGGPLMGSANTDGNGDYLIYWNSIYRQYKLYWEYSVAYSNSYVEINNADNSRSYYFYPAWGKTYDWTYYDERTVYHHVNIIHDFITDSPFSFTDMNYQMDAYVHQGTGINGASDGTDIWFGIQGFDDWARSSDVIYHEYAHAIIYHIYDDAWIGTGTYTQSGAMNEGLPDYFAATINDEARLGESIPLASYRDFDETRTMDNYITSEDDAAQYKNGHIVGGAIWDMRESSSITDSEADELLFDALFEKPTDFDGLLDAILEEDDTDSDLSNGTPHITDILYSFENHEIYSSDPDVPPAAPKNLEATASGGHPRLDWDDNTEPDLQEYDVWRRTAFFHTTWTKVATTANNYWTDTSVDLSPAVETCYYKVKAVDDDDNVSEYSNEDYILGWSEKQIGTNMRPEIPISFSLKQNYPNPFNPETKIQFGLPEDSNVRLDIFNLQGQIVATLVDGALPAGFHTSTFDAISFPSGVYFYKIVAGSFKSIKRMLLVK
jgi:Zn-dependent metalloprotease